MKSIVIVAVLLAGLALPGYPGAESALAQNQVLFGKQASRIELIKDQQWWEPEIHFRTPSFNGVIRPVPMLRLMNVRVNIADGEYFELRVPMVAAAQVSDDSRLSDTAKAEWVRAKKELLPLVRVIGELPDFAPYSRLFSAIAAGQGMLTYVRESDVFSVSRYRVEEAAGAAEIIDLALGGHSLLLTLPSEADAFSVDFAVLPGNETHIAFLRKPMGIYAYVNTQGLPKSMDNSDVMKRLERLMEDALPALLIAARGNAKLRAVHDVLAEKLDAVRNARFVREGQALPQAAPESAQPAIASAEPLVGYAISLHRQFAHKLIYYYRTPRVNGFILLNRYPKESRLTITANRRYFNPDPMDVEALPIPDFTWELDYPRGVNEPSGAVCGHARGGCRHCACTCDAARTMDYQALPEGDLALYYEARRLFTDALDHDTFRESVPGELILALKRLQEGAGTFRPDEAFKPLFALNYREVQGANNFSRVTYQDPDYFYQLSMPPRRGFLSFTFGYGQELAPLTYRFFLAPSGERTQLVVTYPVMLPIGRARLRFKRASAHLDRLHDLAIYFAKQEPGLAQLPPLIADIMTKRELVGPKAFMRPLPGAPYIDWLDAESFRGE